MFKEDDNFIAFDDTDEDLLEVLKRFGILDRINSITDPVERQRVAKELVKHLRKSLEQIQVLPLNTSDAQPSLVVKGKYFNLRKIMFSMLEIGANVAVVAALPPLGVALSAVSLLPSAISTISRIDEFARDLTDTELAVFKAIEELSRREKEKKQIFDEEGINRAEIENYYLERIQEIRGLDKALEMLVKKGVLEERVGADKVTTYYKIKRF